jgi:hypothetical protein
MTDFDLLRAALAGYEMQAQTLQRAIAEIQTKLKGKVIPTVAANGARPARMKRRISAAGIERIREGQRQRWAAQKKAEGKTTAKPVVKKRKLSAAGRAKLVENLKKARQAKAAKAKAA